MSRSPKNPSLGRSAARRRTGRGLVALVGAAGLWGGAAASAVAVPPDTSHLRFSFEHVEQDVGECVGVAFPVHHDGTTNVRFQTRTRAGGLDYFSLRYNTHDVYTNLATGESFTAREVVREADARVTDNGDGTITAVYTATVTVTVHTPSGALFGVDSGRVVGTVHLAVNDPADPDDDTVVSDEQSEPTGVSRLGGFDLCSVAVTLLG
ncbi:hypothetical protein [Oryzobacter terrae]|uniref:hypothetical protein n=1 Tax=Oryzobacter terrae TaxID=1620385 RepID=UPI0036733329